MSSTQLAKTPQQAVFIAQLLWFFPYLCAPSSCHKQLVTCDTKEQAWMKKQRRQTLFCAKAPWCYRQVALSTLIYRSQACPIGESPMHTGYKVPTLSHWKRMSHRADGAFRLFKTTGNFTGDVHQGNQDLCVTCLAQRALKRARMGSFPLTSSSRGLCSQNLCRTYCCVGDSLQPSKLQPPFTFRPSWAPALALHTCFPPSTGEDACRELQDSGCFVCLLQRSLLMHFHLASKQTASWNGSQWNQCLSLWAQEPGGGLLSLSWLGRESNGANTQTCGYTGHRDRNKGREAAWEASVSCFTLMSMKSWLNHENPEFWLGWVRKVAYSVH